MRNANWSISGWWSTGSERCCRSGSWKFSYLFAFVSSLHTHAQPYVRDSRRTPTSTCVDLRVDTQFAITVRAAASLLRRWHTCGDRDDLDLDKHHSDHVLDTHHLVRPAMPTKGGGPRKVTDDGDAHRAVATSLPRPSDQQNKTNCCSSTSARSRRRGTWSRTACPRPLPASSVTQHIWFTMSASWVLYKRRSLPIVD